MKPTFTLLALSVATVLSAQTPQLLKNIHPTNTGTAQQGANQYFSVINNKLLFAGNDGATSGYEPWVSDGTTAGTMIIKDIVPGTGSSDFGGIPFYFNNKYFWMVNDGTVGGELYTTDLTAAGTSLFLDLNAGAGNSYARKTFELNGSLFLAAMNSSSEWILYKSDGTPGGTAPLVASNFFSSGLSVVVGNKAVLAASDVSTNYTDELYVTDGTAAGTVLVKDINPGAAGSNPTNFTLLDATHAIFVADDGAHGTELWVTDGTAAGTKMIKDITPGATGSLPTSMLVSNGKIYFMANDLVHGQEPWVSDGTEAGTMLLKDINPSGNGIAYGYACFMELNGKVVFLANNGTNGIELWRTDGTEANTVMVKDINPGNGHGITDLYTACVANGRMYLRGNDNVHGNEVWYTDGTEAGTQMMYDLHPGVDDGVVLSAFFKQLGNDIFFVGDDGTTGWELYHFNVPVSVKELNAAGSRISVYPNPAKEEITVSTELPLQSITLTNTLGAIVAQKAVRGNGTQTLDISTLPNGIYFLEARYAQGGRYIEKIMKQ